MNKQKSTFHLLGDLGSSKSMCGLLWKKALNQDDRYTVEVNHFLTGRWYTKRLMTCPDCMTALEKKMEACHAKRRAIKNVL